MKPILYEAGETSFTSNGLGRLNDFTECLATEERNGIFELDFEYPTDGAHFADIIPGRIIYATHDDTGIPQPYDIVSYSRPIDGVVTFHAEHISYRQRGLTVAGTNINSLADAFTLLGTAQPSNPFTYEADFTSTAYLAAADGVPRSVRQILGGIEGSILDAYGGEYEWDGFRVILHAQRGQLRDFTIRYGVNMLDYEENADYASTYSSCIPYWKGNQDGQDIIVTGNKVESGSSTYSGRDVCVPLDLTDKFEDAPTTAQLESMAATYMQSNQVTLPAQNIKVNFVRLQDLGYDWLDNLLQCRLCDTVSVVFPRYNMSGTFKIVKTVWNVLEDRYEEMELGALSTTLAEALGISNTADSFNKIVDLGIAGDIAVGGDASIGGSLTANGDVTDGNGNVLADKATKNIRLIGSVTYTSTTSWAKAGDITIPEAGLYKVRASYGNAGVMGLAFSLSQYTAIAQANIIAESTTGMSIEGICHFSAGAYSFWTKCNVAGRSNTVAVTELVSLA